MRKLLHMLSNCGLGGKARANYGLGGKACTKVPMAKLAKESGVQLPGKFKIAITEQLRASESIGPPHG